MILSNERQSRSLTLTPTALRAGLIVESGYLLKHGGARATMVELRVTPSSRFPTNCSCQHHLLLAFKGVDLVQIAAIEPPRAKCTRGSSTIGTSAKMTVTSVIMNNGFRRVATPQVGYSAPLSFGAPMGATFWEQYPTTPVRDALTSREQCLDICLVETVFVQLFRCLFSLVGLVNLGFFVWAYKSLKVSSTFTHIRKHLQMCLATLPTSSLLRRTGRQLSVACRV